MFNLTNLIMSLKANAIHLFLTADSGFGDAKDVPSSLGIHTVTTAQMTGKVNGILTQIGMLGNSVVFNIIAVLMVFSLISTAFCAVFFKKGVKWSLASFLILGVVIMLFKNIPTIIGWFMTISS